MFFDEESNRIRELVRRHKVCWEVQPEYHIDREGKKIQIGFELQLTGTHHEPKEPPSPGCPECVKVYSDLLQIAESILPKADRKSRYEISVFDSSIRYSSRRKFRGEMSLSIRILHKGKFDDSTDDCQVECLEEMEGKLKELGAQKGEWTEPLKTHAL
jgi:hypothetical protein